MAELKLEIISPSKAVYSGLVKSVTLPGTKGSFQVLHNHAPLMSTLEIGLIIVQTDDVNKLYFSTAGGTAEVLNNNILVLADSVENVDSIDIKRAENSLQRAKERLEQKGSKDIDMVRAELAMARAMNRITLAEKYAVKVP